MELNFFPHFGTNYVFVVDNSLKKTNKHQLHLLKVKSTEIVIKSCRWDKVSCVKNKANTDVQLHTRGVRLIIDYTRRLRPKGVPVSG